MTEQVDIPVIASGGMGKLTDLHSVVKESGADAVAMAHVLHYRAYTIDDVRSYCLEVGIPVRKI